jgi:hypothetical protein
VLTRDRRAFASLPTNVASQSETYSRRPTCERFEILRECYGVQLDGYSNRSRHHTRCVRKFVFDMRVRPSFTPQRAREHKRQTAICKFRFDTSKARLLPSFTTSKTVAPPPRNLPTGTPMCVSRATKGRPSQLLECHFGATARVTAPTIPVKSLIMCARPVKPVAWAISVHVVPRARANRTPSTRAIRTNCFGPIPRLFRELRDRWHWLVSRRSAICRTRK